MINLLRNKFDKIKVINDVFCVDTYISGIYVAILGEIVIKLIPYKEISIESEVKQKGDFGKLIISQWLAEQKHLI